jgi:hypothetical protein
MDYEQRRAAEITGADVRERRMAWFHGRGRSPEQVRELRQAAAKSCTCCAQCFAPLSPSASVEVRWFAMPDRVTDRALESRLNYRAGWNGAHYERREWLRAPICLLCSIDNQSYQRPLRFRCLGCGRPIRHRDSRLNRNDQVCCADCERKVRNERNRVRRRVVHEPRKCSECGEYFVPKREDAETCSNKCRQAKFRIEARLGRS